MLSLSAHTTLDQCSRLLFWVVILNIAVAIDTMFFWVGFFTETTFPIDELRPLINNFDGYYAWERCFVVPDTILAWHRKLIALKWTYGAKKHVGRPGPMKAIKPLIARMALENSTWGYCRTSSSSTSVSGPGEVAAQARPTPKTGWGVRWPVGI